MKKQDPAIYCSIGTIWGGSDMREKTIFLAMAMLFIMSGCASITNSVKCEIPREAVLTDGMKVCASTEQDSICIEASTCNKRTITWDGKVRSINLVPRKERWLGTLGLVAPKQPNNYWKDKDEITAVEITEAEIRYKNVEDAVRGMDYPDDYTINVVYNDNGLLFQWRKSVLPDGMKILDLMIFQILINGEKPKSLPGSQNDKIVVSY